MRRIVSLDLIFLFVAVGNIVSIAIGSQPSFIIFKILIMPVLMAYFTKALLQKKSNFKSYIIVAFIFSWLGDILLIWSSEEIFFILGLASFLIAQIMYIRAFNDKKPARHKSALLSQEPFLAAPLVLFGIGLNLLFIQSGKYADLLPAVGIYTLILISMVLSALNRNNKTNSESYRLIFRGALFFLISDMFIAVDKFYIQVPGNHIIVMSTYIVAQYLILRGAISHVITEKLVHTEPKADH